VNRAPIIIACACGLVLALIAFQAGRRVEGIVRPVEQQKFVPPMATADLLPENVTELFVTDIAAVPFADLYRVLRSAKPERRREWFDQLQALPKGPQKWMAFSSFFKTLVQLDAKEALRLLEQIQERYLAQIASDAVFKAAPTSAMPDMAEFFLRINYRETGMMGHLGDAIEEWSRVDPVAVSQFFDAHAGNERFQSCFNTFLFQWARQDPEAAWKWFQRQKSSLDTESGKQYLNEAVNGFIFGWFNKDKSAALDFAISNASNRAFHNTIDSLAMSLFLDESEEDATKFIKRLPSELQEKAVESVVRYTTTGVILGKNPKNDRSAETMLKWVMTLPQEASRDEIGVLGDIWRRDDPAAFSAWFAQQSPQTKDRIVYVQCTSSSHENPGDVLEQAKNISDPGLREKALATYAFGFATTPEDSIKLIRKTNLSTDQKAYLSRLVEEHKEENDEE
jgi:hypothetical protein